MRIGWIGIGRMGRPMVENLVRKGFDVTVQNRSQGKVHELAAMGATPGESFAVMGATPGESFAVMGAELDEVHTCLPDTDTVRQVLTGAGGVLDRPKPGLIVVDHSTIHPDAARALAAAARERGASFIDAPVSGSGPVAERGELTIMCGGDEDAFAAARPAMEAMGRTVELMGASGSGAATKVVSNFLMATNLAVAMEALLLADKAGLDLERLFAVIRTASGASRAWERNVPRILKREFGKDGSAWLTMKDLDHAHELAVEFGLDLQIFQTGRRFWHAVVEEYGLGEEDPSHGFTALEQRLGVTLGG